MRACCNSNRLALDWQHKIRSYWQDKSRTYRAADTWRHTGQTHRGETHRGETGCSSGGWRIGLAHTYPRCRRLHTLRKPTGLLRYWGYLGILLHCIRPNTTCLHHMLAPPITRHALKQVVHAFKYMVLSKEHRGQRLPLMQAHAPPRCFLRHDGRARSVRRHQHLLSIH